MDTIRIQIRNVPEKNPFFQQLEMHRGTVFARAALRQSSLLMHNNWKNSFNLENSSWHRPLKPLLDITRCGEDWEKGCMRADLPSERKITPVPGPVM